MSISIRVEYAFQVSALLGGITNESFPLEEGSTLEDLVNVIMEKYPGIKNFDLRSKYYTMFGENGAIYITKCSLFIKTENRLCGKIGFYEMPEERSLEIDSPFELHIAEETIRKAKNEKHH